MAILRSKAPATTTTITAQNGWKYLLIGIFGLSANVVGAWLDDVRLIAFYIVIIGMLGFFAFQRHTLDRFLRLERTHRWWGAVGAWTVIALALLGLPAPMLYIVDYRAYLDRLNTLDGPNHALVILVAGVLLFVFRFRARLMYGITEIVVGCYLGGQKLSSWHDGQLAHLATLDRATQMAALSAGVYLVVRGLDNMDHGLKADTRIDPLVVLIRHLRTPKSDRIVAETDPIVAEATRLGLVPRAGSSYLVSDGKRACEMRRAPGSRAL